MRAVIDKAGRVLLPKVFRTGLGLEPGTSVDISAYGDGLQITKGGRIARLEREESGRLVAVGSTPVTDEVLFGLMDAGRR
ncbi:MAG: AbrB/MazE/SpoVT family DNA-binding domain-containing protein [Bifidobacteriaceae bacterium]|jgi:AbrB family looped-hinge helix DNA binding protein|nr:AbrB/MazE/SpoVT family DNA-binding domain-containing protein [Bifidobacteriaceae bacterium]